MIIVKWRKGGKPLHDYQKYIPFKYAKLFKPRTPNLTLVPAARPKAISKESNSSASTSWKTDKVVKPGAETSGGVFDVSQEKLFAKKLAKRFATSYVSEMFRPKLKRN